MWCANCQNDVAAEVSTDNQQIHCASCGSDIGSTESLQASAKTREARELLERWAKNESKDPYAPMMTTSSSETPAPTETVSEQPEENVAPTLPESSPPESSSPAPQVKQPHFAKEKENSAESKSKPKFRLDGPHPRIDEVRKQTKQQPATTEPSHVEHLKSKINQQRLSLHAAHTAQPPAPHFDIEKMAEQKPQPQQSNAMAAFGQWMAYGGVLVITVGAAFVISGYFGGPEHYTSTGWLISTLGQMLMFLGVVTLVSGGMEQTTDAVKQQIDLLGERIILFEKFSMEQEKRQQHSQLADSISREQLQSQLEEINQQLEDRQAS